MLKLLAKLFGAKQEAAPQPEVPYKVEAPATPSVAEKATEAAVESIKPAKKKAPAKKPAIKKEAVPKRPRKPKAQ